jgi:SNF2 family DNA or RNA helicase
LEQGRASIGETFNFFGQPKCLSKGCELQPHQLDALKWMASLYENGLNGILADDMVSINSFLMIGHLFREWARQ